MSLTEEIVLKNQIFHLFWKYFEKIPTFEELILYGGRGNTKSKFVALLLLYRLLENEHFDVRDISFEAKTIREKAALDYQFWIDKFKIPKDIVELHIPENQVQLPYLRVYKKGYYNEVNFCHAKGQAELIKGTNPRSGQKWGAVRYFELTNFKGWTPEMIENNNSTYTREAHDNFQIIYEFNTPLPGSSQWWVYRDFIPWKQKDPHCSIVKVCYEDMTEEEKKVFLNERFIRRAEQTKLISPKSYDFIYRGEVPFNNKSCYPYLDKTIHFGDFGSDFKPNYLLVGVDLGLQAATCFCLTELELQPGQKPKILIGREFYYHTNDYGTWEINNEEKPYRIKTLTDYAQDLLDFLKRIHKQYPHQKIQLQMDYANQGSLLYEIMLGKHRFSQIDWNSFMLIQRRNQQQEELPDWLICEESWKKNLRDERIEFTNQCLMIPGILKTPNTRFLEALYTCVYDERGKRKDVHQKDSPIDCIDAFEYCWTESQQNDILGWLSQII